ncbi:putative duf167 domain protein [Eutypa lata UCREL1]|uniref:Putative duf167 domain protein n=1 Tax=Eutypa lata (strain UCR-EL1) TaxID=1287681 RepID=M7TCQ4_EUTLA|nr:putative duf167 domain protein [Eutypa lata UCREL1]
MATRKAIEIVKKSSTETLLLRCHVRPGASKIREGVTEVTEEAVQLCVAAQPQDGKSNKAVIEVLSDTLGIPKSDLQIVQGTKNRDKTIGISTMGLRQKQHVGDEELVATIRQKLLGN